MATTFYARKSNWSLGHETVDEENELFSIPYNEMCILEQLLNGYEGAPVVINLAAQNGDQTGRIDPEGSVTMMRLLIKLQSFHVCKLYNGQQSGKHLPEAAPKLYLIQKFLNAIVHCNETRRSLVWM